MSSTLRFWPILDAKKIFPGPSCLATIDIGFDLGTHCIKINRTDKEDTICEITFIIELGHVVFDYAFSSFRASTAAKAGADVETM